MAYRTPPHHQSVYDEYGGETGPVPSLVDAQELTHAGAAAMTHRSVVGRATGGRVAEVTPWMAAFGLAVAVFSGCLLVSSLVVIRSLEARADTVTTAGAPFEDVAAPGPASATAQESAQATLPPSTSAPPSAAAMGAPLATAVPTPDIDVPAALAAGPVPFVADGAITEAILGVLGDSAAHYGVAVKQPQRRPGSGGQRRHELLRGEHVQTRGADGGGAADQRGHAVAG